jgi:hypothetical protein
MRKGAAAEAANTALREISILSSWYYLPQARLCRR